MKKNLLVIKAMAIIILGVTCLLNRPNSLCAQQIDYSQKPRKLNWILTINLLLGKRLSLSVHFEKS